MRNITLTRGTMLTHPTITLTDDGLDRLGVGFGGLDIVDDIFMYVTFVVGSSFGRIWAVQISDSIQIHADDKRFATVAADSVHAKFLGLISLDDVLVVEAK